MLPSQRSFPQLPYLKVYVSPSKPLPYFYFLLIEFTTILHYVTYLISHLPTLKYEICKGRHFVWHVYSCISVT